MKNYQIRTRHRRTSRDFVIPKIQYEHHVRLSHRRENALKNRRAAIRVYRLMPSFACNYHPIPHIPCTVFSILAKWRERTSLSLNIKYKSGFFSLQNGSNLTKYANFYLFTQSFIKAKRSPNANKKI